MTAFDTCTAIVMHGSKTAQIADRYIENLNNLTIYGNARHRYFGSLLRVA